MARAVSKVAYKLNPAARLANKRGGFFGTAQEILDPGSKVAQNAAEGKPITGRNLLDPANAILHAPPGPPAPPPTFPDVEGAQLNAKRAVRRRAVTSGLGSTVLTGGYSPTGQASSVLGGG